MQTVLQTSTSCKLPGMIRNLTSSTNACTTNMDSIQNLKKPLDDCKRLAAITAVKAMNLQNKMTIGIGSGTTVIFAVEQIAKRIKEESLSGIHCVPSSFQAKQLIEKYQLSLASLDTSPVVDWTIDGADEVDRNGNMIKGGGGCLTQEKILACASKQLFIIVDYTKSSDRLGDSWKKGIPIEVIPMAYVPVKNKIEECLSGQAILRIAEKKAGPVVTDNGNFILDWVFPSGDHKWAEVEKKVKLLPGVVEVGLFVNMAKRIYVGAQDQVKILEPEMSHQY